MHLGAADFVDLADGNRPESSQPHLASCEICRAQLAEIRTMMAAAGDAGVPEPSPLFWEQLSVRVREAVEAEREHTQRRPVRSLLHGRAFQVSTAIAAVLILAVFVPRMLTVRDAARVAPSGGVSSLAAASDADTGADAGDTARDDVWLTFVADLAAPLDADAARDEGLDALNAEEAVTHLNDGELRELERLLQAQIRNQGD